MKVDSMQKWRQALTLLAFADNELALSNLTNGFQENNLNNKPAGVEIGFTTDDVDAAFNRALQAGAVSLVVPKQKPWGQKVGYVRDLDGILIEIASLM